MECCDVSKKLALNVFNLMRPEVLLCKNIKSQS